MAIIANAAGGGNAGTSASWVLCDAVSSNTSTTTGVSSFVGTGGTTSPTFSMSTITIDAIALFPSSRASSPTGTIKMELQQGGITLGGGTVTINVADIDLNTGLTAGGGFIFFKFASPLSITTGSNYAIKLTTSSASQLKFYQASTTSDWTRIVRSTSTQAPIANDNIYIAGDFTAAGTSSSNTITWNITTTTNHFASLDIGQSGIVSTGSPSSTALYMKAGGNINIWPSGTFQVGTSSGTPIPNGSSFSLELACASLVQFGLIANLGSTLKFYGLSKTYGLLLGADVAVSASSVTLASTPTNWKSGDQIVLGSTSSTPTDVDVRVLSADVSTSSASITANTTFAHTGTGNYVGEAINTTRNIKIFATSNANASFIQISSCNFDMNYVEMYNLGSGTASKTGLNLNVSTGSFAYTLMNTIGCSLHDFNVASTLGAINLVATVSGSTFTIDQCCFYNNAAHLNLASSSNTTWSITNLMAIRQNTAALSAFTLATLKGTFTGIVSSSNTQTGFTLGDSTASSGTIGSLVCHSNTGNGILFSAITSLAAGSGVGPTINGLTAWRVVGANGAITLNSVYKCTFSNITSHSNTANCIQFTNGPSAGNTFSSCTLSGGTSPVSVAGVSFNNVTTNNKFFNCTFSSIGSSNSTGDINMTASLSDACFYNSTFNAATRVANISISPIDSNIRFQKLGGTLGDNRITKTNGTVQTDTTIFGVASPSVRATPSASTSKLEAVQHKVPCANGQTCTVSVRVRKSVIGDGTAYNGNQPRLILRADSAMGATTDTVAATATNAANGAFQTLSYTTAAATDNGAFTFSVDCDGTTGWINVDDWTAS